MSVSYPTKRIQRPSEVLRAVSDVLARKLPPGWRADWSVGERVGSAIAEPTRSPTDQAARQPGGSLRARTSETARSTSLGRCMRFVGYETDMSTESWTTKTQRDVKSHLSAP